MLKIFKLFICLLLPVSSVIGQDISIRGIFPEDSVISLKIYYHAQKLPAQVLYQKYECSSFEQTITFPIPPKQIGDIGGFCLIIGKQNINIFLKEIEISNIFKAYAHEIKKSLDLVSNTCPHEIQSIDGQFYLVFLNKECGVFIGSQLLSNSSPIGFQLFLRLSFLAILLLLIFIITKQASTQRLPLFSIALFLASLPFHFDYTNYTMGFMILIMVISFIYNKSRRFAWQPVFYVPCAMYLMNVIGLSYTGDLEQGVKRLDTTIVLVLFPIVFSMIQFTQKNVVLLLRFFVWSVIAFCVFGLLSYITIIQEFTFDMAFKDSKLYAPLLMMWPSHWHPSMASTILLMATPITIYLYYSKIQRFKDSKIQNSKFKIIETFLGVLLPIAFTVLSGARVGMVIVPALLGLGYLFYCKFKPALKWGLVVAGIIATIIVLNLFPNANDRFTDPIRTDLQKIAISAIKEKPVFGWGTGSAKSLIHSEERSHDSGIETVYDFNQFHNQYLEDMVQFGIAGILILLVLFGWILWIGVSEKNYLLLSLLIIYGLCCYTETPLFGSKGVIPFTFWLCFLMSNRNLLTQNKIT